MTTTPQEPGSTGAGSTEAGTTAETLAHSQGEPDAMPGTESEASDLGGPAEGSESSAEDALTAPSDIGDDQPDSQSRNPM
jgi:hypothetical protein